MSMPPWRHPWRSRPRPDAACSSVLWNALFQAVEYPVRHDAPLQARARLSTNRQRCQRVRRPIESQMAPRAASPIASSVAAAAAHRRTVGIAELLGCNTRSAACSALASMSAATIVTQRCRVAMCAASRSRVKTMLCFGSVACYLQETFRCDQCLVRTFTFEVL